MRLLAALVLLTAGVVAGLLLAEYLPRKALPPTAETLPVPEPGPAEPMASPVVRLHAYDERNLSRETMAVVVSEPGIVVARVADFAGANRIVVETSRGERVLVDSVLASNDEYGLAALGTERLLYAEALQPESGAGGLYLGRGVALLTPGEPYRATVDSAGVRDGLGAYRYSLRLTGRGDGPGFAIVKPDTRQLLGLVAAWEGYRSMPAFDAEPVHRLLDSIGVVPPRSLAEFATHYFNDTTRGRLALLEQLVATEQFDRATEWGKAIIDLDDFSQRQGLSLLLDAYAGVARNAIETGRWGRALEIIDEADARWPLNPELLKMRAQANEAVGELALALDDLLALPDNNAQRIRSLVLENALATGEADGQATLELVDRALQADPDYAPYHRLRGQVLARKGQMNAAIDALERAVALDPSMEPELQSLMAQLQSRRNTPAVTEVPIYRTRGVLFVNARINGSNEQFRFLFDTGASYTAITAETALRLGINNIFFGAPVVELETANGRVYTTTAQLQSIDISGARVDNVEAVILESMRGVDGLLGQSFLRHFDIHIDRSGRRLVFSRRLDD